MLNNVPKPECVKGEKSIPADLRLSRDAMDEINRRTGAFMFNNVPMPEPECIKGEKPIPANLRLLKDAMEEINRQTDALEHRLLGVINSANLHSVTDSEPEAKVSSSPLTSELVALESFAKAIIEKLNNISICLEL